MSGSPPPRRCGPIGDTYLCVPVPGGGWIGSIGDTYLCVPVPGPVGDTYLCVPVPCGLRGGGAVGFGFAQSSRRSPRGWAAPTWLNGQRGCRARGPIGFRTKAPRHKGALRAPTLRPFLEFAEQDSYADPSCLRAFVRTDILSASAGRGGAARVSRGHLPLCPRSGGTLTFLRGGGGRWVWADWGHLPLCPRSAGRLGTLTFVSPFQGQSGTLTFVSPFRGPRSAEASPFRGGSIVFRRSSIEGLLRSEVPATAAAASDRPGR
jgi:hypothetical protein